MKLRNPILIIFILFAFHSMTYSQWKIGLRSGIHFAKQKYSINDEFLLDFDKINGLESGIFIQRKFLRGLGLRTEINYIQKGSRTPFLSGVFERDEEFRINEIEGLFFIDYRISIKDFFLFGGLGSMAGYSINGKRIDHDFDNSNELNFENTGRNKFDWGIIYGGGIGFEFSRWELFLESRYRYSFNYAKDHTVGGTTETFRNIGIDLNLGIAIYISK